MEIHVKDASNSICPGFTLSEYLCINSGWENWILKCNKQINNIKSNILDNIESTDHAYTIKYFIRDNEIKNGIPAITSHP